jgi:hypothetical protein
VNLPFTVDRFVLFKANLRVVLRAVRPGPTSGSPPPDENTIRERMRQQATQDVEETYSLLLEHLGLTAQEKDALFSSIEEPELIERILAHRRERGEEGASTVSLGARGPPQPSRF